MCYERLYDNRVSRVHKLISFCIFAKSDKNLFSCQFHSKAKITQLIYSEPFSVINQSESSFGKI